MAFNGFTMDTLMYFEAIRMQNSNTFYYDNLAWYKNGVRQPLIELAEELAPVIRQIDPALETRPGKAVSRIRRDTRFTRDKSPFRDHMWISWRQAGKSVSESVGFWFEITTEGYTVGLGFYDVSPTAMNCLRAYMQNHSKRFLKLQRDLHRCGLVLNGPAYVRGRPGAEQLPADLQAWYNKKSFSFSCRFAIDDVFFSPQLTAQLAEKLLALAPLYKTLQDSGMLHQPV